MAGDWIKMGKDLLTHPKVVRMSSALRADRLRTVGGLFAVWCLFDTHSADGQLSGYTPEALDELVGMPGISAAMEAVGWLSNSEGGVSLPRFEEHNGQSAKRRAQETDRKREDRKTSASDADKKRTREEKRREEVTSLRSVKETGADRASPTECPDDVDAQVWMDWLALRKDKRAKVTYTVIQGARQEASKAGMTFEAFLRVWCRRGSQGLEADWLKPHERASPNSPVPSKYAGASAAIWEDEVI